MRHVDGASTNQPASQLLSEPLRAYVDDWEQYAYIPDPPFRSASAAELVIADDPFRRPVRPHDLPLLDFAVEMKDEDLYALTGLAAHRILLNIYEADVGFLPAPENRPSFEGFDLYYSDNSRRLGEIIRPSLEAHVFSLVDQATESELGTTAALRDMVLSVSERTLGSHDRKVAAALVDGASASVATLLLAQIVGPVGSACAAKARTLLFDYGSSPLSELSQLTVGPDDRSYPWVQGAALKRLAASCRLAGTPHAYWQFYLGSTLALTNYLHRVTRDRRMVFESVGAMLYDRLRTASSAQSRADLVRLCFGDDTDTSYFETYVGTTVDEVRRTFDSVVAPAVSAYGVPAVRAVAQGFDSMRRLHDISDDDFVTQVRWADRPDYYRDLARRIDEKIRNERIPVELDTFVESCEETSTTHVHDDDRLLVIEDGVMEFWNMVGQVMRFEPGDKVFVPRGRLHGSTVTSAVCTYHQPIITADVLAACE